MLYQLSYVRVVNRHDSNIRWHPHPGEPATDALRCPRTPRNRAAGPP